jgi:hypothetical protein
MPVRFYPQRLTATIDSAFRESLKVAAADAEAHSGSSKAGAKAEQVGLSVARLVPTGPIGAIQEKGAGPHAIAPRGTALRLADGTFVSGTVQHPGRAAKPYIRPAASRWANGGFQSTARAQLAARGFR